MKVLLHRHCAIALIFLACTFGAAAQRHTIDSALAVWQNTALHDTSRLNALHEVARVYLDINIDTTMLYAEKSLAYAQSHKQQEHIAESYKLLSVCYRYKGDYEKAIEYTLKAIGILKKNGNKEKLATQYNALADIYMFKAEYKNARDYCLLALDIRLKLKNDKDIANSYITLGWLFRDQGLYPESVEYNLKALKRFSKIKDEEGMANCLNNVGIVYALSKDSRLSLTYFLKGLKIRQKYPNLDRLAGSYSNVAAAYRDLGQYDTSIYYFKKAQAMDEQAGNKRGLASTLNNMGTVYSIKGDFEQAFENYAKVLDIYTSQNDNKGLLSVHNNMAMAYYRKKDYASAIKYGLKVVGKTTEPVYSETHKVAYNTLYHSYKFSNRYKESVECMELYVRVRDSLMNKSKIKELARLESQYEYENQMATDSVKHVSEINVLQSRSKLQADQIRNRNIILMGLLVVFILLAIVAWLMVKQSRLKVQKRTLELEQQALLARMNPHFLFNALNSIQTMFMKNNHEAANDYLTDFAQLIRNTLDMTGQSTISLQKEVQSLELYLSLEQTRLEHGMTFSIRVDNAVDKSTQVPTMIIQPFIENAIWHGISHITGPGMITVDFYRDNFYLYCKIQDNGIGLTQSRNRKKGSTHISKGIELTRKRLDDKNAITLTETEDEQGNITGTNVIIRFKL